MYRNSCEEDPYMETRTLERQIRTQITGTGQTIASAESCTGGGIAYRITTIPGSSAYFVGGIVAYTNDLKAKLLGVRQETLDQRGAVSEECAREMAEGICRMTGASIGVSTTGIAGPSGATNRKPVGLIYIACASPSGTTVHEVRWRNTRAKHMHDATEYALRLILDALENMRDARSAVP
jgi:PncC family amidohydrolase